LILCPVLQTLSPTNFFKPRFFSGSGRFAVTPLYVISQTNMHRIQNRYFFLPLFGLTPRRRGFPGMISVLFSSRPGLGLEDPRGQLMKVLALTPQALALALALREKSWPWPLAKTFSPRSRPRGCCTCMLCSNSQCHMTVCRFFFRNVSQTCM